MVEVRFGWFPFLLLTILGACSSGERVGGVDPVDPGDEDGGSSMDPVDPSVHGVSVAGTVWAPGNAPGMVPSGTEIPVYDALVHVSSARPAAIPQGAYCEECEPVAGYYAQSSHNGTFMINRVLPGDYWLVVQKGQFRIERQITIAPGSDLEVSPAYTTLPSVHNPSAGDWVPHIAIATGSYDSLEDVIGKMGVGGVDSTGTYQLGPGSDQIDFYANGGRTFSGGGDSLSDLVSNLSLMLQYHIIFIPCSSSGNTDALRSQQVLRNIRDYVAAGGKLYVTDWSGEWHDNVFPEFIQLGAGYDTPASAYNAATDTWTPSLFGDADGPLYDSPDGETADANLFAWLNGQYGPTADGATGYEFYDATNFFVEANWNTVENLGTVIVGRDHEGLAISETPQVWVIGSDGDGVKKPLTVTYEPAGCGRVLFSTYHTTESAHAGLVPQERILLYLIMEIGVCVEEPIVI